METEKEGKKHRRIRGGREVNKETEGRKDVQKAARYRVRITVAEKRQEGGI